MMTERTSIIRSRQLGGAFSEDFIIMQTKSNSPDRYITPQRFKQLLESTQNLVAIETEDVADMVAQFRQLAVRSGQAVYLWQNDAGLLSLREGEVSVPGIQEVADVLRLILHSPHFGVYLFHDFAELIRLPTMAILRQVARKISGNKWKVILIGKKMQFPEGIEEHIEWLVQDKKLPSGRPQLRNGQWIIA